MSFLGTDSYFKESFWDTVAAVRGTIFDLNLDNNYLYVHSHEVSLASADWKEVIVPENKPLDLLSFDFIKLEKFIKDFKDKAWQDLNTKFDEEYFRTDTTFFSEK